MKMISGNDAVDIAGEDFPRFFSNLDIAQVFYSSPNAEGSASESFLNS